VDLLKPCLLSVLKRRVKRNRKDVKHDGTQQDPFGLCMISVVAAGMLAVGGPKTLDTGILGNCDRLGGRGDRRRQTVTINSAATGPDGAR